MLGHPCPICEFFSAEQHDKIANRRKYQKKTKDRSSIHRPDLSAELDTAKSEVSISAEREATLLDLSTEAQAQPEPRQEAVAQNIQGRDPTDVQNVILNPLS